MAAPLEQDGDEILEDDYYSLLNVSREASKTQIDQAYKQLCKVYHPDKHQDPNKKKNAELLFSKLKRAHEVLADEHKRVVYDLYGEKGMESYPMEVVSRTKTPAEIIAEYKRFQEEQEERLLQRFTNPKTHAQVSVDSTDIFEPYMSHDDETEESTGRIPNVEISGMSLHHSVECPLTTQDTCILANTVASSNGNGSNILMLSWKRLLQNQASFTMSTLFGGQQGITCVFSKQLIRSLSFNVNTKFMVKNGYAVPTLGTGLSYQFDKHWRGSLYWNILNPSKVNTVLEYNSETQQAHFRFNLGLVNRFIVTSYTRKFKEQQISTTVSLKAGKMDAVPLGVVFDYGIEKKITAYSHLGASVSVGYPTGVSVTIKCDRGNHTFLMPIRLSDELIPSAVLYGTFIPIVTYFAVKKLIVDPFISGQREKELDRRRQEQREKIAQKKKEAQALVELMKETVDRNIELEERRNGLIIITALYGKLSTGDQENLQTEDCIDVTLPLQALVKESNLITPDKTTKCDIPGFYDPCIGEEKSLYIKYRFRKHIHHTTVKDMEKIRIPQQRHLYNEDQLPPFANGQEDTW